MKGNSRPVTSAQTDVSEQLSSLLAKHLQTTFKKPFHAFSPALFEDINKQVINSQRSVILDSGCGTGISTGKLAARYPDSVVIGIDKSQHRLHRYLNDSQYFSQDNVILVRADLIDFWRLIAQAKWPIEKHYLLYPNPWPKPEQLKKRWHGHPVFPTLTSLCNVIELRTNWRIYADEFKQALAFIDKEATVETLMPTEFISPFERKYAESGHSLYRLTT